MKLRNLISGLVGLDTSGVEAFKVDKIGQYLQSYSAKVSKVDLATVLASIVSARSLASFIRSLSGMDTSGVNAFSTALTTLGNVSMLNSTQDSISESNNQVIDAINALRADLNAFYSDDEKEIALYLNSKKVASTLAKDMNRQLAVLQKRGAY